ncbi:MAG TPA: 3-oxoacyl-[acyl-carrier-protein] synthase III C-terminal domain-containing protein [Rubrobacteraceae bacterium]|nr:3-oxoacyl-[acyl-carrier-protein] synthase III C-terminal domain-containing protein [Rubrobacteraceae bacterium]
MEPSLNNPRILSAATAVPPYRIEQKDTKEFARRLFAGKFRDLGRLLPVFDNGQIETRHSCRPLEWFGWERSFPERNALYVEHALELSEKAARRCLDRAGVEPGEVGTLFFVSTTGISTPSLDAKLLFGLGLSPNLKRVPVWGLGCAGGAAGVARAADYARAYPEELALVIVVELCSLTFQVGDISKSNLVAASLFADGAAAVLLGAGEGPEVLGSHSTTWPGTEDVMGWDLVESGLKVRFAKSVPRIVRTRTRATMEEVCEKHEISPEDLRHLVVHPGGMKVLEAYEEALGLESGTLALSREILREYGNMSSASVLFVLERFLESYPAGSGEYGSISALGPGFSAEHVLFRC